VLIIPSSWGSQRAVTYKPSSKKFGVVAGEEEDFCQGESLMHNLLLCFCFALFYFCLYLLSKIQKNSSLIVVTFTYLLFSLARMSNPEVKVRTFKQQGERV
jgi:hypothetical protein